MAAYSDGQLLGLDPVRITALGGLRPLYVADDPVRREQRAAVGIVLRALKFGLGT